MAAEREQMEAFVGSLDRVKVELPVRITLGDGEPLPVGSVRYTPEVDFRQEVADLLETLVAHLRGPLSS
jgi:hypothetical protein